MLKNVIVKSFKFMTLKYDPIVIVFHFDFQYIVNRKI